MKKNLFIILALLASLIVFISCNNSVDDYLEEESPIDPYTTPLTLEFIEKGEIYAEIDDGYCFGDIFYSINNGEKRKLTNSHVTVVAGDKVALYRKNTPKEKTYYYIAIRCTSDCYIYGNAMSLIADEDFVGADQVFVNSFTTLFEDNKHIKSHSTKDLVLPATKLAEHCYSGMFAGCTGITRAFELPATDLAPFCYSALFQETSIKTAPALPATTLASSCYYKMFENCTSLVEAPELPALEMEYECYLCMFQGCTSLVEAPYLPAETYTNGCYKGMFKNCKSLKSIRCNIKHIETWFIDSGYFSLQWVKDIGSTGTFYRNPDADWPYGENAVPSGWEIKNLE